MSVHACALMMANASLDCLTTAFDKISGNLDRLIIALGHAGLELPTYINGEVLDLKKENIALRVAYSVERALDARPPQEVAEGVLGRYRLERQAWRTDDAACEALATTIRDAATGFAARGPKSAAKVTVNLPSFPARDPATLTRRREEYDKWTGAPAAEQAAVSSGVLLDSYALGTKAALRHWPEWRGRPTVVAAPFTEIEGVELGKIKEMDVLAKMLRDGEKKVEGKKRKRQGDAAEKSGEEESG